MLKCIQRTKISNNKNEEKIKFGLVLFDWRNRIVWHRVKDNSGIRYEFAIVYNNQEYLCSASKSNGQNIVSRSSAYIRH